MGVLKHLLFWPVTGPSFLARFSLEKVEESVRGELTSDDTVKEDLLALQMRLELGEIDDDQYVMEEAALMMRLRDVRHWREQFGMGVSSGPVRVGKAGSLGEEDATLARPDADRAEPKIAATDQAPVEFRLDTE